MKDLNPKIWLGCLASYNNGSLHGDWVDAHNIDELNESLEKILESSPMPDAEEYYIADYEDFNGCLSSYDCTHMSLDDVAEIGEALYNLNDDKELEVLEYLISDCSYPTFEALSLIDDVYYFEGSMLDYAYEYADSCLEIPEHLENYIDYERLARDLSYDCYETKNLVIVNHGQI